MTIQYQLANGAIVKPAKDCNCVTHEGPHWLHMDRLDADSERAEYDLIEAELARVEADGGFKCLQHKSNINHRMVHLAKRAMRRLQEKKRIMQSLQIVRIIT